MPAHLVVPYPATNSTVRVRGLRWVERAVAAGRIDRGYVKVHGPGFDGCRVPRGEPVLLLRNAKRITRGRLEARLLRSASPGVYDLDDGLPWDDGNLPRLGHWAKRAVPRSLVARRAARAADRMIVGNDVLAEWAAQHCADVRVVPTCVDPADYSVRESWDIDVRPPILGWIGSPATEGYLIDVAPALGEVHRRTGARVVIVSGPGPIPSALAGFTDKAVWRPDSARLIASWDVGLMPLRDGVYERAKCGYKLLQYAASGVPAVGSPVGVNQTLLTSMDGLAPVALDDWVGALTGLLAEPAERRAARARAGLDVAAAYSYDAWEKAFIDAAGWGA
jgi:glycosyltransferase involved in cell wall biosynthesis